LKSNKSITKTLLIPLNTKNYHTTFADFYLDMKDKENSNSNKESKINFSSFDFENLTSYQNGIVQQIIFAVNYEIIVTRIDKRSSFVNIFHKSTNE
jgi:hypothetical protein